MTTKAEVRDFLAQPSLAIVGVSRGGRKFGNIAFRTLKSQGYLLYPVHPEAEAVEGVRCYPNLRELPEPVGGVVVVVPPARAERVVADAAAAGIRRIWLQQGAESQQAIQAGRSLGLSVVHGECILMFAEPMTFGHKAHRWLWGLLGKLPI